MEHLKRACLGFAMVGLMTISTVTKAQDAEKTKATIIYQMMDLDYRFGLLLNNRDSDCRVFFANQSKTEFQEFKTLVEANITIFKPGQQVRFTNLIKSYEEILMSETVFPRLKEVGDAAAEKQIAERINRVSRNLLIDNLQWSFDLEITENLVRMNIASELNHPATCAENNPEIIRKGNETMPKYLAEAKIYNEKPLQARIETLLQNYKAWTPEKGEALIKETKELFENGLLKLTPAGKVADKEATKAAKAELAEREVHLKMIYPTTKVYLKGMIRPQVEGEKYKINLPAIHNEQTSNRQSVYFNTDGKSAKKDDVADLTFTIIAPGISNFRADAPRYMDGNVRANTMFKPLVAVKGYVVDVHFTFPVKVEVRNKAGELEKTIVVVPENKELTDIFHGDFLRAPRFEESSSVTTIRPFMSADSAGVNSQNFRADIISRLRINRWAIATALVSEALTNAYGSDKLPNSMYPIYTIKDAKPEQADLVALIDRNKEAINNIGSKEKTAASIAELKTIIADYEKRLTVADITPNMKALCLINAAQSALMTDDINKSVEFYKAYLQTDKSSLGMQDSYEKMLPYFYFRGQLTDVNASTITLQEPPASFK
jgi:hypothetical protein